MEKFIKKNIEVEAIEFTGEASDLMDLENKSNLKYKTDGNKYFIETAKGDKELEIGDFILLGINGEFDICKHDIFQKIYSPKQEKKEEVNEVDEKNEPISEQVEQKNNTPESEKQVANYEQKVEDSQPYSFVDVELCKNIIRFIAIFNIILFVSISITLGIFISSSDKNIEKTIKIVCQEEIEKESKKLLEQAKIEATQIIEEAKTKAKQEADNSFRMEMQRLTNERIEN